MFLSNLITVVIVLFLDKRVDGLDFLQHVLRVRVEHEFALVGFSDSLVYFVHHF